MSGGPYGPGGVLSDFGGGGEGGGSPRGILGESRKVTSEQIRGHLVLLANETLPEAQRTQGIEFITQIIQTAEAC